MSFEENSNGVFFQLLFLNYTILIEAIQCSLINPPNGIDRGKTDGLFHSCLGLKWVFTVLFMAKIAEKDKFLKSYEHCPLHREEIFTFLIVSKSSFNLSHNVNLSRQIFTCNSNSENLLVVSIFESFSKSISWIEAIQWSLMKTPCGRIGGGMDRLFHGSFGCKSASSFVRSELQNR